VDGELRAAVKNLIRFERRFVGVLGEVFGPSSTPRSHFQSAPCWC